MDNSILMYKQLEVSFFCHEHMLRGNLMSFEKSFELKDLELETYGVLEKNEWRKWKVDEQVMLLAMVFLDYTSGDDNAQFRKWLVNEVRDMCQRSEEFKKTFLRIMPLTSMVPKEMDN